MRSTRTHSHFSLLLGTAVFLFAFEVPTGWIKAGSKPDSYDMGIDPGAARDGKNTATIKSIRKKVRGFGTLMQMVPAGRFAGNRVRDRSGSMTSGSRSWDRRYPPPENVTLSDHFRRTLTLSGRRPA